MSSVDREPSSDQVEVERAAEAPVLRPAPSRVLVWLLGLALLYTLYFAKTLLMPMLVALLFALLLGPLVAMLKRLYVPRSVSAVFILCALLGPFSLLVTELSAPAQKWAKRIPELSVQLSTHLSSIAEAMRPEAAVITPLPLPEEEEPRGFSFFGLFGGEERIQSLPHLEERSAAPANDPVSERLMQGGMEMMVSVLGATPVVISQFLICIILILFLLIFGPRLFTAFVDIFPQVRDKQRTIALVETIQRELSRYILTVSVINTCLGLTTAAGLWLMGVEDPLLWGVLVGLLNFAPYVGPLIAVIILALAGLDQYGPVAAALIPLLVYFPLNVIEAQFITPLVLGRNMRLNPLVLMLWLLTWGWLWGAAGVLLAVPLLVCLKLAAAQLNLLQNWVRLIETRA